MAVRLDHTFGCGRRRDVAREFVRSDHVIDDLVRGVLVPVTFQSLDLFLYPIGKFARLTIIRIEKTPITTAVVDFSSLSGMACSNSFASCGPILEQ